MSDQLEHDGPDGAILRMTAEIVSAYVSKNVLPATQSPKSSIPFSPR